MIHALLNISFLFIISLKKIMMKIDTKEKVFKMIKRAIKMRVA